MTERRITAEQWASLIKAKLELTLAAKRTHAALTHLVAIIDGFPGPGEGGTPPPVFSLSPAPPECDLVVGTVQSTVCACGHAARDHYRSAGVTYCTPCRRKLCNCGREEGAEHNLPCPALPNGGYAAAREAPWSWPEASHRAATELATRQLIADVAAEQDTHGGNFCDGTCKRHPGADCPDQG